MAAVVRIHRPSLTQEERDQKMEEIRKATKDFHKAVIKEKK